jgi:hypothetical protein
MGLRGAGLAAVAVAVLGIAGTACEPPPPAVTLRLHPSATYEVLTGAVGLTVDVACAKPGTVFLRFAPQGSAPMSDYASDSSWTSVSCPGTGGGTFTTNWRWGPSAPTSLMLIAEATRSTYSGSLRTPNFEVGVRDAQTVTFSRILCWFGLSKPCAPA